LSVVEEITVAPGFAKPSRRQFVVSRDWPVVVGGVILAAVTSAAALAPWLPLANPNAVDPVHAFAHPFSHHHLLGSDEFGRDLLSRIVWGGRISLLVGIGATLGSAALGSSIGLISGYFEGPIDLLLMRLVDAVMAFPFLLLAIAVVAMLGPGLTNAMLAITIVGVPFYARLVRGNVIRLKNRAFVQAGRTMGFSHARIITTHVVPHLIGPLVVFASVDVGYKIIATAGLSFLGLGTQPPTSDWGTMLASGRNALFQAPLLVTIPGIAIALVVLAFNLIGDWLRDRR
jgi:peptide/nickel transport system permease protein